MTMYQLHLKQKGKAPFPLPVYGTKRNIWEALAKHLKWSSFKQLVTTQGIKNVDRYKAQFEMREAQQ